MNQTAGAKQQLQDAFELFSQVSERRARSCAELRQKVAGQNEKLAAVHTRRLRQLANVLSLDNSVSRSRILSSVGEMTVRLVNQVLPPPGHYEYNLMMPAARHWYRVPLTVCKRA